MKIFDLIIIGSGPAGLTAGIYARRFNMNCLVIGEILGGMIFEAHKICNFPTQNNIKGFELTNSMFSHFKELGGELKQDKVKEIKKEKDRFIVKTNNNIYETYKIVIATGRKKRELNVRGEKEFFGKGVSYCATCDAGFFKDKIVAVIGGGNTALSSAVLLSEYASKVYLIYRKAEFLRAEPELIKQVQKNGKIKVFFNTEVKEIIGKNFVEVVLLKDGKKLKINGIFIEIGFVPENYFSKQLSLKTKDDYIVVDKMQKTSLSGVFAAGDVTNNPLKQVITACGEGANSVNSAYFELKSEEK